jgi:hypothetical protein
VEIHAVVGGGNSRGGKPWWWKQRRILISHSTTIKKRCQFKLTPFFIGIFPVRNTYYETRTKEGLFSALIIMVI